MCWGLAQEAANYALRFQCLRACEWLGVLAERCLATINCGRIRFAHSFLRSGWCYLWYFESEKGIHFSLMSTNSAETLPEVKLWTRRVVEADWMGSLRQRRMARRQRQVARRQRQVATSQRQVAASQRQVAASQRQVAASQRQVAASQRQVATSQRQVATSQRQIAASQRQVAKPSNPGVGLLQRLMVTHFNPGGSRHGSLVERRDLVIRNTLGAGANTAGPRLREHTP